MKEDRAEARKRLADIESTDKISVANVTAGATVAIGALLLDIAESLASIAESQKLITPSESDRGPRPSMATEKLALQVLEAQQKIMKGQSDEESTAMESRDSEGGARGH